MKLNLIIQAASETRFCLGAREARAQMIDLNGSSDFLVPRGGVVQASIPNRSKSDRRLNYCYCLFLSDFNRLGFQGYSPLSPRPNFFRCQSNRHRRASVLTALRFLVQATPSRCTPASRLKTKTPRGDDLPLHLQSTAPTMSPP